MREIREQFEELTQAYTEQFELYKRIGEVGSQEDDLINKGNLECLLQVLKEKEELLKQASGLELQIKVVQEQLISHFGVANFSIPQLKLAAPVYYQDDLSALEGVVAQLVPILEQLESQERQNEAALTQYLDRSQELSTKTVQMRRAGRAYSKEKSDLR